MRGLIGFLVAATALAARGGDQLHIVLINPFPEAQEIFWVNGDQTVSMGTVQGDFDEMQVNTYPGHTFGWRMATGEEECSAKELLDRVTMIKGMSRHVLGELVELDGDYEPAEDDDPRPFEATFVNRGSSKMRIVAHADCGKAQPEKEVEPGASATLVVKRGCVVDWVEAESQELLFRSVIQHYKQERHMYKDEEYTELCLEQTPATNASRSFTWSDPVDGRELEVHVLSEDPFVAYITQWSAGTECLEMEQQAKKIGLSGAQVFGVKGILADRRAQSANLYWNERNESAMTNTLIKRAFEFTRQQRHYKIREGPFQEPLNFIEYSYGGEYRPHCDGVCHRTPYKRGGRVATLIHYCKAATRGGATVFPKTGIKVVPEPDSALLFAYKRDDGYMDDGHTLHTGCLVREGPKQIVAMWMREDANENESWDKFPS